MILIPGCNSQKDLNYFSKINTSFFFSQTISSVSFNSIFYTDDGIIKQKANVNIIKIKDINNGVLYLLKLDKVSDVKEEFLNLGYFYVQKDNIFQLDSTQADLLLSKKNIPKDARIVCQDNELPDSLGQNEIGVHQYIMVDKDLRKYHYYNNSVESGFYENITWEKNKGIVKFESGYGAQRDGIELSIMR